MAKQYCILRNPSTLELFIGTVGKEPKFCDVHSDEVFDTLYEALDALEEYKQQLEEDLNDALAPSGAGTYTGD